MWGLISKFILSIGPAFIYNLLKKIYNGWREYADQKTRDEFAVKAFEKSQKEYAEKMASDDISPEEKERLFEENIKLTNAFRNR